MFNGMDVDCVKRHSDNRKFVSIRDIRFVLLAIAGDYEETRKPINRIKADALRDFESTIAQIDN